MAHRTISLEDIRSVPEAFKILIDSQKEDKTEMENPEFLKMLHDIGFDIKREIECEVVNHRPLVHTKEVFGPRWIGHERRDAEWMASPHCTKLNKLEVIGLTDPDFQKELVEMSNTPNYTAMFIDSLKDEKRATKKKESK